MRTLGDKQRKQPQQTKEVKTVEAPVETPNPPAASESNQIFDESVALG
jgi:hypothetical protein